jgi:hypothetical protein
MRRIDSGNFSTGALNMLKMIKYKIEISARLIKGGLLKKLTAHCPEYPVK